MLVCAVPVLTQNVSGIKPELEAGWALVHGAPAFLSGTCVQVLYGACGIQAAYFISIWLQDICHRWFKHTTVRHRIAACVPVMITAPPVRAMDMLVIPFRNVSTGARVRVAFTLFATTLMVIRVGAIPVIAENVCSIIP
jgi:hypothetical protein